MLLLLKKLLLRHSHCYCCHGSPLVLWLQSVLLVLLLPLHILDHLPRSLLIQCFRFNCCFQRSPL
jgi:hypothetical protein